VLSVEKSSFLNKTMRVNFNWGVTVGCTVDDQLKRKPAATPDPSVVSLILMVLKLKVAPVAGGKLLVEYVASTLLDFLRKSKIKILKETSL